MAIANLTEEYVRTLKVPKGEPDVWVWDEKLPRFGVRKYAKGHASYMVKYSVAGQQRKRTLGRVVAGNLKAMRLEASAIWICCTTWTIRGFCSTLAPSAQSPIPSPCCGANELELLSKIDATDIEPEFLAIAQTLQHPLLTDDIRGMVTFLPACLVVNFTSAGTYDAVICMNALCYLSEEEQLRAIWKMSSQTERFICVTRRSQVHQNRHRRSLHAPGLEKLAPDLLRMA